MTPSTNEATLGAMIEQSLSQVFLVTAALPDVYFTTNMFILFLLRLHYNVY